MPPSARPFRPPQPPHQPPAQPPHQSPVQPPHQPPVQPPHQPHVPMLLPLQLPALLPLPPLSRAVMTQFIPIEPIPPGIAQPAVTNKETTAPKGKKAAKKKATVGAKPSKNWTVKRGKAEPPTSDDYKDWNLEQLRRECTARGKVIERAIEDERAQRESYLEESDNDRMICAAQVDSEMLLPPVKRQKQSDNIRLCNVLFSDLLAEDFARTEDQKTRPQIDNGERNEESDFWATVEYENACNDTNYNLLYVNDPQFAEIDASQRTPHDAAKLRKMWKDLITLYRTAYRKSTASGSHGPFIDYCDGRLDVAYVDVCVQINQGLTGFCRGSMPEGTRMDSNNVGTQPQSKRRRVQAVTPSKRDEPDEVKDAIRAVATYLGRKEAEASNPRLLMESVLAAYKVVEDMRGILSRREAQGQPTDTLCSSINIQEQTIAKLEYQLREVMGLPATTTGTDGLDISL